MKIGTVFSIEVVSRSSICSAVDLYDINNIILQPLLFISFTLKRFTLCRFHFSNVPNIWLTKLHDSSLNLFDEFQEYAEDTFVSFLVSRLLIGALLSLHLHFVAQYKFFVIIYY